MEFELVECKRQHIKDLCSNLRAEDERELCEMSGSTPLKELLRCRIYSKPDERWAVVQGDKTLMVLGLVKIGVASSCAKMWMACSKDVSLANRFILQETSAVIIFSLLRYETLIGDIDRRHKKAKRFFERVGCKLEEGKSITGLPVYCATLTRDGFRMSKANRLFRASNVILELIKE